MVPSVPFVQTVAWDLFWWLAVESKGCCLEHGKLKLKSKICGVLLKMQATVSPRLRQVTQNKTLRVVSADLS